MNTTLDLFFDSYQAHGWCQLDRHLPSSLAGKTKYAFFDIWETFIRMHVTKTLTSEELLEVTPHERLLEITLCRLEAAKPYKDILKRLAKDMMLDPKAAALLLYQGQKESAFYLNYAGLSTAGPIGQLKVQGYYMAFIWTLQAWLKDDSDDMAPTMANLDRTLNYCDTIMEQYL